MNDATGDVVVLDGGMSNALADRGHDLGGQLWTARLLSDAPDEIAAVHRAYFAAGARVATTATYQASVPGFTAIGIDPDQAADLVRAGVRIARQVVADLANDGVTRLVAASVGPYGAYLADGSEYRGRYGVSARTLRDFHGPRLELLAAERPDLFAVETVPDTDAAQVLVDLLNDLDLTAWFSYSVAGERTRAGQPLEDAFALAAQTRNLVAVGANCCAPAHVLAAVESAVATTGLPAVCYPNSGEAWASGADDEAGTWSGESTFDAGLAPSWVDAGARYIGGCCRVGPAQIADLTARLNVTGPTPDR